MIEQLLFEAMAGTMDRDLALCRMTCKMAASRIMFCRCGAILDQEKTVVINVRPNTVKTYVMCQKCWQREKERILKVAKETGTPMKVETWNGLEYTQGDWDVSD